MPKFMRLMVARMLSYFGAISSGERYLPRLTVILRMQTSEVPLLCKFLWRYYRDRHMDPFLNFKDALNSIG